MAYLLNIIFIFVLCICVNGENTTKSVHSIEASHRNYKHTVDINGYCDINKNCSHDTVCVDNHCRCKPTHTWNPRRHRCDSYNCRSNELECKRYDPNRECVDEYPFTRYLGSKCNCAYGYNEDQRNHKCRKFCFHNYECDPNQLSSETNHMTCVDYLCQCKPNFKWNVTTSKCDYFECTKDSECWGNGDENRECISGICECNYEEDLRTKKCYLSFNSLFKWKNYHSRKETLLLCTIFIIPIVLSCCLYSYCRKKRRAALSGSTTSIITKDQLNNGFTKDQPNNGFVYQTKTKQ